MARLIVKSRDLNPLNPRYFNGINNSNGLNGSISRLFCFHQINQTNQINPMNDMNQTRVLPLTFDPFTFNLMIQTNQINNVPRDCPEVSCLNCRRCNIEVRIILCYAIRMEVQRWSQN